MDQQANQQIDGTDSDQGIRGRYGRRALILGAAAGAGAIAATVGAATPAGATDGSPVIEGVDNTSTGMARTGVFSKDNDTVAVLADEVNLYGVQGQDNTSSGTVGIGVLGQSIRGTGVKGETQTAGQSAVLGTEFTADGRLRSGRPVIERDGCLWKSDRRLWCHRPDGDDGCARRLRKCSSWWQHWRVGPVAGRL
jgi:hypothetical protein